MKTPSRTKWIPSFITAMHKNEKLCTSFTKIGFIAIGLAEGDNERKSERERVIEKDKRERERERERDAHFARQEK